MVIYDRLIEAVVEGSECTEQEERDHGVIRVKSTTRGSPFGFDCSTINKRDTTTNMLKDEQRPVSLARSILVQLPEIVAYLDRLSRYISYYLWSVLVRLESR